MRIELISKGYNEGNRLVSVIEKKLGKLDKYFPDDSAEAKVKLSTVSTDTPRIPVTAHKTDFLIYIIKHTFL